MKREKIKTLHFCAGFRLKHRYCGASVFVVEGQNDNSLVLRVFCIKSYIFPT